MFRLKAYRDTLQGLPDILNYACYLEDGILLNKDGSLTAGFYYRGSDISSLTNEQRSYIAVKINAALLKLENNWSMHIDCSRTRIEDYIDINSNIFSNEINWILEKEREMYFTKNAHFESIFSVTITYLPPLQVMNKIRDLMFIDEGKNSKNAQDESAKILAEFKTKVFDIQRTLKNYIRIFPMVAKEFRDEYDNVGYYDDLLEHINFCITANRQKIRLPSCGMYLDSYIGTKSFVGGLRPMVEDKHIGVVAIDGFPSDSFPNILNAMSELGFEYRFNTRFIFLDKQVALKSLNKHRAKWKQKVRGWVDELLNRASSKIDQHAQDMVMEIDEAIREVNEGIVAYGYYTANIVIHHHDIEELEKCINKTKSLLEKIGFVARVEDINAIEAFLGTLPAHSYPNLRRSLINTLNLSHLLPLASIWAGEKYCPSDKFPPQSPPLMQVLTHGSTPFRLNLHVGDVGHTLIFGPTGAGKSTLLANLFLNFQKYSKAKIFAFDKGKSLLPATLATKGTHYNITVDKTLAFAPLANLKDSQIAWAADFLEVCMNLQLGRSLDSKEKEEIMEALRTHKNNQSKTITDFTSNLQNEVLRSALNVYSIDGKYGYLLDSEEDLLNIANITTFEIEELMTLGDQAIMPVLLYLFNRIEATLDGSPAMIIIDEAWIALSHDIFKQKIVEWLKVLRKANCLVVLATQSLSDAFNSGILDKLIESCPTKIFLPNPDVFNKGSDNVLGSYDYYKAFGLNDAQLEIIRRATPKKEYYYCSPLGNRLFDLALGKVNLSLTTVNDKESIKNIENLYADFQENWVFEWLKERNVNYKIYERSMNA
ncbi:conjugal transfer protein TrbE [Helicobacter monodelphidis]|uniref:VirB4 family type IV secretion/conjugal transfer ATPase n=1 Tax=Helicobacter sp. 15-1451 TaxID=2004995 RepID=UPI000DCC8905|nr:conjugal transfer protein TrbE [Helicobacter sp. 15-1451]RAX56474.1 conjugal transfer protein TrbE [Helicobacter sp. 15-1451]